MVGIARKRVIRPAEVRRQELLDAASAILAEDGIAGLTVSAVTTRAGVAKGSFYLHFDARQDLLQALRVRLSGKAVTRLEEVRRPVTAGDWPGFLDAVVDGSIGFLIDNRVLHDLLATIPHEHREGHAELAMVDRLRGLLGDVIADGAAAGAIDAPDPAATADLLYELLHAAGHLALADPARADVIRATSRRIVRRALHVGG